jgi:hypothetical protein
MKPKALKAEQPNLLEDPEAKAKANFGRVPAYLAKVKSEIEAEREYILHLLDQEQLAAESSAGSSSRELNEEERAELVDALKTKWDQVNDKYQVSKECTRNSCRTTRSRPSLSCRSLPIARSVPAPPPWVRFVGRRHVRSKCPSWRRTSRS